MYLIKGINWYSELNRKDKQKKKALRCLFLYNLKVREFETQHAMKFTSILTKLCKKPMIWRQLWNLTPHDISEWDIDSEDELMNSIDDPDELPWFPLDSEPDLDG